jgi:dihydroneopterin triphosphate diphosphatase
VLLVVRRGAEFLVLRRAPRYDAFWHFVAGAIEPGETAVEAALRELLEETGLDAGAALVDLGRGYAYPLLEQSPHRRWLYAPQVREVTVSCFSVEAPAEWEPALNEEHDDYRWCAVDDAEQLLYWPEPREVLREVARP